MANDSKPGDKASIFADDLDSRLWSPANTGDSTRDIVTHRLDVVLQRCGFTRRSAARLEYLQRLLTSRGIIPTPSLTTEGLERDERIRFGRSEPAVVGQGFKNEKDLQRYIKTNVDRLELFRGYSVIGTEYVLHNNERIDMLLESKSKRTWLVVELEKEQKDESVIQLLRYMNEVKERRLPAGYGVEGMILSGRPKPEQIQAFEATRASYPGPVQWIVYSVTLSLSPAEGSIGAAPAD